MSPAFAVIGANYGDEGKGRVVDHLAARLGPKTVVIRHNGGAQSGHTVVCDRGRHVFGHFGAGTLAGASTYLAKHFVCNPLIFWKEAKQLAELKATWDVAVDPRCFITTPYDILLNQAVEQKRGTARHGSVGVGFGETIERNSYATFQLWRNDLSDEEKVRRKLKLIRNEWLKVRWRQLDLPPLPKDDPHLTDEMLEHTIEAFLAFHRATKVAGLEFVRGRPIIFEAGQGLALDMDSSNFPHVTRSNTGIKNALPILKALNLSVQSFYCTRAYITKHGAGPLPRETDVIDPDRPFEDSTNVNHPYQGRFRLAHIDIGAVNARIATDEALFEKDISRSGIVLTCCDHVSPERHRELLGGFACRVASWSADPHRDGLIWTTPLEINP